MHFIVIRVHIRSDRVNPPVAELDQRAGRLAGPIRVADMVPGDHVYIENKFDYRTHYPEGAWNGENAIYMDKDQFAGLGVGLVSEIKLRTLLAQHYNEDPNDSRPDLPSMRAIPSDMEWTLVAVPSLFGAKDEAGQFTNP